MVARDEYGHFLFALAEPGFSQPLTLVAECLAARMGILKVQSFGTMDIILKSDSIVTIKASLDTLASCD